MTRADRPATAAAPSGLRLAGVLWLLAVLLYGFMIAAWSMPPLEGTLSDTDDYMRMTRVYDLIDGAAGPSYAAPRLGVGGAAEIGWSRLVDAPLVAVQIVLEKSGMTRADAAMLTATVMPGIAIVALVFAAFWYARPLVPGHGAVFVYLALLLLWGLLRQFMPGRVDHHMWQIILGTVALGALVRVYYQPQNQFYPLLAGLALGTGLAVGADILISLTFCTALLGWFWLWRGGEFERAGAVFGAATLAAAAAWHVLLHDAGRFMAPSCDSLSVVWLMLATIMAAFWGTVYAIPAALKQDWRRRLAAGFFVALPLLALLFAAFPACFHDPYQIANPLVRQIWLDAVREARSVPAFFADTPVAACFFIVPPALAAIAAVLALRLETKDRVLWAGLLLVLLGGLLLTFYQIRTVDFAQSAAIAPLAWGYAAAFAGARALVRRLNLTPAQRLRAAAGFFIACVAFFIFAAATRDENKADDADRSGAVTCDLSRAAASLNALPGGPQTVAAFIDDGSEILFRTRHRVLAAPYHRNQAGILAAYEIITADSPAEARALMDRYDADIVMLCDSSGNLWTGDKKKKPVPFAQALFAGTVTGWLRPVGDAASNGGYVIFKKGE